MSCPRPECPLFWFPSIAGSLAAAADFDGVGAERVDAARVDSEIVVVGQAPSTDAGRATGTVTVIPVDERLAASADLPSVIDAAAGTTVRHLGGLGDWAAVSIRGSTLRQVIVCLDGIPLNPDGSASVNLAELPLRAFSRVEVWRGNAPAELGVGPIGGVVNLVSGDAPATALSSTWGSLGTAAVRLGTGFSAPLGGIPTDGAVFVDTFTTRGDFRYFSDNGTAFETFDDRLATRQNNEKAQTSGHVRWRFGDSRARLTLIDSFVSRAEGLPGSATRPAADARLDTGRNLAAAQFEANGASGRWRGRVHNQRRVEQLDDRAGEIGIDSDWRRQDFDAWGAFVDYQPEVGAAWAPGVTVQGRRDGLVTDDLETGKRDRRLRTSASIAVSSPVQLADGRVRLAPVIEAAWLDDRRLGSEPLAGLATADPGDAATLAWWTPRLGAAIAVSPGLVVETNAGGYRRPPDLFELFGQQGVMRGNPALVPEQGVQADLGVRWTPEPTGPVRVALAAVGFWGRAEQRIVFVQNAQQTLFPMNVGRADVRGAEGSLDVAIGEWLASTTTFTGMWSENRSADAAFAGRRLPRIPGYDLQQATGVTWRGLRAGHTFSYTAANYWDQTNWFRAAPRPLHGAFVRARAGSRGPEFEFEVRNVADRIVEVVPRNPLAPGDRARVVQPLTDFSGYPLPGRTFLFSVRWEV